MSMWSTDKTASLLGLPFYGGSPMIEQRQFKSHEAHEWGLSVGLVPLRTDIIIDGQ